MKKNTLAENMQRFGTKNLDEAGKFYKGSRYNDEPFKFGDDKRSLATKTNPEWDAFVDKYNNTPGFETSTSADGTSYKAEITNLESGLKWVVMNQKGNNWSYIGRDPSYLGNPEFCRDAKELIANFKEINGINESISSTRRKLSESVQPSQEDMVTFNGKQHAVLASAWDESSINPNDSFTANKIRQAGANPTNWVLLQAAPGPYDYAYDDLGPDQLRSQWNTGAWMFVPADKLQPASASSSATATTLEPGSWEAFTAAIANKINTDKNDMRTNLTSAEIDSAYEKMNINDRDRLWNGIWGEYKWSVGTNKPGGAEQAVDQAIRDYFSKVK